MRPFAIPLACATLVSLSAWAQDVYRWVDKKGHTHYTNDLALLPDAGAQQTEGVAIQVSNERPEDPKAKKKKRGKEVDLADASVWRARFLDLHSRIDRTKDQLSRDEHTVAESNPMIESIVGVEKSVSDARARLQTSRDDLKKLELALTDLERIADELEVPADWRK